MKTFHSALFLLMLTLIFCEASAQHTIPANSSVAPGETIFEYVRVTGDSSHTFGTIYERISEENGFTTVSYTQVLPNATLLDTIIFASESIEPSRYHTVVANMQDISIDYDIPGTTSIQMMRDIPGRSIDTSMTASTNNLVYDYHWPHLLIGMLTPLEKEEDVINLPVFTYRNQQDMQPVSFMGKEQIELHGIQYDTCLWKAMNAEMGIETTYWIDARSKRLVKSKSILRSGVIFWLQRKNV